jgi:hypothetical protein
MDEQRDRRDAVEAADATGLIAGEQLITQAETMLPLRPDLPDLHGALPAGHEAHATVDALHGEVHAQNPNPEAIARHVGTLRSLPELEARIANWWDDPVTQNFIGAIGRMGL